MRTATAPRVSLGSASADFTVRPSPGGVALEVLRTRGNLRIATQAQALSDGEPGATIAVRNLQTKKQVYAIVKDGTTVEIH